MSTFRVAFDGAWQEDFETLIEAVEWGEAVAEAGRTAWVIEQRPFSVRLQAVFPEEHAEEARKAWKRAHDWRAIPAAFGGGFPG